MLKISHPVEAPHVADFQTQALLHLARHAPALPVQRLLPMRDGAHAAVTHAVDGQARVVRLFSYLEGLPMPQAARSARQQASVARALARLDLALQDMAPHLAAGERMPWDIQRADSVRGLVAHLGSPERRALVEHALDRFEQHVLPRLAALRRQPIHNDFNIYNLLVDPADTERVCGILDFGDMVEGPLVNDVAVAASYQLDERGDAPGALAAISAFAAAYHRIHPLHPEELDLLPDLIRARLAMVVCIGGWRAARNPANADYVLRNNQISWARLQACRPISHAQAQEALRLACPDPLPLH
ncbi:MAG: Homoserine kinase [Paracidovorax wautersii]|uniref:Hydroxylysine kinase n=1 Tax=Paracidovorax wautersii TaxID=1177982 RepID=A0A7V8FMT9_9BURK|nr:MAG: Homoserine kinase [Paracidovorax wautersii]